ncbi:MAG: hypothetical protein KAV25_02395 [Methanophagales archaeon]|nr:hypothetical protein [Methanophagales archaeon]
MEKIEEVEIEEGCIKLPVEFIQRLKHENKVLVRLERFGLIVKPKIDPVEDLIGCVKSVPRDIEKQLDERVEEDDSEIY